jgi:hypothetical protein
MYFNISLLNSVRIGGSKHQVAIKKNLSKFASDTLLKLKGLMPKANYD